MVLVLQRRLFKTNSDASSYMKGEVEFDERRMNDMEFTDVVDEANKLASGIIEEVDQTPVDTGKEPKLPKSDKGKKRKTKRTSLSVEETSSPSRCLTLWVLIRATCLQASS